MFSLFSGILEPKKDDNPAGSRSLDAQQDLLAFRKAAHDQRLHCIRTLGYTYLKPPGVSRTMQAMAEDAEMAQESGYVSASGISMHNAFINDTRSGPDLSQLSIEDSDDPALHLHIDSEEDFQAQLSGGAILDGSQFSLDETYDDETYQQQGFMPRSDPPGGDVSLGMAPPSPIPASDTSMLVQGARLSPDTTAGPPVGSRRPRASLVSTQDLDPFSR